MWENGPEKVEKKNTVAHSTPDVTPRKKKKVRSVRGTTIPEVKNVKIQHVTQRYRTLPNVTHVTVTLP